MSCFLENPQYLPFAAYLPFPGYLLPTCRMHQCILGVLAPDNGTIRPLRLNHPISGSPRATLACTRDHRLFDLRAVAA
jgi:hypothetical protein